MNGKPVVKVPKYPALISHTGRAIISGRPIWRFRCCQALLARPAGN